MEVIIWVHGLLADLHGTQKIGAVAIIIVAAVFIFDLKSRFKAPEK